MFDIDSPPVISAFSTIRSRVTISQFSGPRYDQLKFIFLCMTPRSGSSYLSSALTENGVGRFAEHFRIVGGSFERATSDERIFSYEDYVRSIIDKCRRKRIFGAKVGWNQFAPLMYSGAYDYYFSNALFLYLTREDILAQAISRFISTETGYFHSTNSDLAHTISQDVPLDMDKLSKHIGYIVDMQSAWERFFATRGIRPLRFTYEHIDRNPEAVLLRIFKFVKEKIPSPMVVDTKYKRVRNERHEAMRALAVQEFRKTYPTLDLSVNGDVRRSTVLAP